MRKISFEDACILSVIRIGRLLVRVLPARASIAIGRGIGGIVYLFTKRSRIALKNLRMAFASEKDPRELRRIAKSSIQNVTMSIVDLLRIPELKREDIERDFTIEGREHFEPYLKQKKGVIFLTGHYGSWELLNIVSGLMGYPATVLARVQKHPRSDAYLNGLRRSKGSSVIHKGMPIREILRALKGGQIVGILSDQDGGKQGCFVDFLGRSSSTPPGAAAFSMRTGAPIFPTFITRLPGGRHRIQIEAPLRFPPESLSPEEGERFLLQQFARSLERKIRETPEQWLWAHRRWKSSPDRRVLVLSDGKAGHVNQSLAVLEAIRRERRTHGVHPDRVFSSLVEVRFRNAFVPKLVRGVSLLFRGHLPLRPLWMRLLLTADCRHALERTYADVVISCGSSLADINLWMKQLNQARSVVVMKPALPSAHFDAVIVPKHDRVAEEPHVFTTDGALSALQTADLELEGGVLAAELGLPAGKRRIGVLVGGDTDTLHFERGSLEAYMGAVHAHALESGAQILLTTSRRTPHWADQFLKKEFADRKLNPLLLIANEGNRQGVVAGILGLSDALVVTAESMSMVSEAVSAGKPVLVIRPWKTARLKKKYEDYLARLEKEGKILIVDEQQMGAALERAAAGPWEAAGEHRRREDAVLQQAARRVAG
jgi:Kdo2-lipid IVA lauroyltransferase/acyltransferase